MQHVTLSGVGFVYSGLGDSLAALPCVANCSTLRIAYYEEVFFDANGALEWLLGTHAVAAGVKHLSIRDIDAKYLGAFLNAFITAIVQVSVADFVRRAHKKKKST